MRTAPAPRLRARAGFSLAEMLIALTLTAVIGGAVTTLFVSQNRFFESQEKAGTAREVSRGAITNLMSELRMIEQDSGVVAASDSVITLRVPIAMGIICAASAANIVALVMPFSTDIYNSNITAYRGYMFRPLSSDTENRYTYVGSGTIPHLDVGASSCTSNGISTTAVPGSRVARLSPGHTDAQTRWPVMLYTQVTYRFANSTSVPGRLALYRQQYNGTNEELVAPFASTASFRFFWGTAKGASQASPPSDLSDLIGIDLVLDGLSERPNPDGTFMTVANRTSVFFKNRRS